MQPTDWLLVEQCEHARQSHAIASAWRRDALDEQAVEQEFLAAVLRHDDGWLAWAKQPGIDPVEGRPYAFTEMPPADAQAIWDESIAACRAVGPLAGWLVASHFHALQSKREGDFPEWVEWLSGVDRERDVWLREWMAISQQHTDLLATRLLAQLQAFDWISLWLCCCCQLTSQDLQDVEPLTIGGGKTGWPECRFTPQPIGSDAPVTLIVEPWPFAAERLDLSVSARRVPADRRYESGEQLLAEAQPEQVHWQLIATANQS